MAEALIRLSRDGVGIELLRGRFDVFVDGREVAEVAWRETIEIPLEPGDHRLQVRSGRYSSPPRSLTLRDGEVVSFRCHGAMMWPRYVLSVVKPDLGISLSRGSG
jgi:hypothetical protein